MNVLDTLNFVNIVFGGDLNVDFDTADHFCGVYFIGSPNYSSAFIIIV